MKSRKIDVTASKSPYRFQLSATGSTTLDSSKQPTPVDSTFVQALSKSSKSAVASNEKNWLLTKAWLIDNINRLRRELSELERDYSGHLDSIERSNSEKEKQFIEDITKLRADHTLLSQQQKQIIYLIKKNQMLRGRPTSENDIHFASMNGKMKPTKVAVAHIKRQMKRDLSHTMERPNTEMNKEIFAELSSLHDITLTLAANLQNVERRIENRNQFK